jgi:hypothetical protein
MTFIYKDRPSDSSRVETIWQAQTEHAGSFISTASTHWEMVLTSHQGRTIFTVRGPETKARCAVVPASRDLRRGALAI